MTLTEMFKKWLVENAGVKEDASDDEFRKAAADALANGDLSVEKFTQLTSDPDAGKANELESMLKKLSERMDSLVKSEGEPKTPEPAKSEGEGDPKPAKAKTPTRLAKMVQSIGGVETDSDKSIDVRVKEAAEQYSTTKSALLYPDAVNGKSHPLAGRPVRDFGRQLDSPSDLDMALAGAWAKYQIFAVTPKFGGNAERSWSRLNEHEKELLCYLTEHSQWDDSKDDRLGSRRGYPGGIKALIDDSTSGGLEAAPIVFDDQVIQTPLLHGELFPRVNTVPLDRGRRVEGVSTGTVTGSWGGGDDSAISLFNTASYVSAFDTTVFVWDGAIRIGLDFMSDTPIDFGAHITQQYGERLLEDLDDVIATGNGTSQPEGVMNKSGTTSVTFGGSTTIGNYESLRFGVAKAEHRSNVVQSAVFCGTETSYQRARALAVGGSDARRLFGLGHFGNEYRLMDIPYAINESLTNQQLFFAILARYRMYRRRGLAIDTSTEGDTLKRRNEMLIIARARYGGQLERGAVAAVATDAPS